MIINSQSYTLAIASAWIIFNYTEITRKQSVTQAANSPYNEESEFDSNGDTVWLLSHSVYIISKAKHYYACYAMIIDLSVHHVACK